MKLKLGEHEFSVDDQFYLLEGSTEDHVAVLERFKVGETYTVKYYGPDRQKKD